MIGERRRLFKLGKSRKNYLDLLEAADKVTCRANDKFSSFVEAIIVTPNIKKRAELLLKLASHRYPKKCGFSEIETI